MEKQEEMPKTNNEYRLIYFNHMGGIEPVRLLFALARVPYDDVRISHEEWTPEYKTSTFYKNNKRKDVF